MYSKDYLNQALDKVITRRDYYFFSFSDFEWSVYKKEVAFGILGQVFVYNEVTSAYEEVKEFIEGVISNELESNKNEVISEVNNEDELLISDIRENSYYFVNASNDKYVYFYKIPNLNDRKNSYFNLIGYY